MAGVLSELYVVGGKQRGARSLRDGNDNWHGYDHGLVVAVDAAAGTAETRLEYASPPDVAAEEGAISFQAGALEGDRLYVCTETEVLVYGLPGFDVLHYVTLPWFNDVHHVRPTPDGHLLVASAGLELVIEVTVEGEVRRLWNVLGEDPWARFDPEVDWRKVASTKPHRAHPNFLFYIGAEPWATRFHQGDAISLDDPGRRIAISDKRIHDGVVHDGRIHFSTVDGHVLVADATTLEVVEDIDLNAFHADRSTLLGWCRGILVDGDRLWVGFSRIRPTRFRENVGWVSRGFKRDEPTHVGCYDLATRTCVQEVALESTGMSAVYGIFPAAPVAATSPPR